MQEKKVKRKMRNERMQTHQSLMARFLSKVPHHFLSNL